MPAEATSTRRVGGLSAAFPGLPGAAQQPVHVEIQSGRDTLHAAAFGTPEDAWAACAEISAETLVQASLYQTLTQHVQVPARVHVRI